MACVAGFSASNMAYWSGVVSNWPPWRLLELPTAETTTSMVCPSRAPNSGMVASTATSATLYDDAANAKALGFIDSTDLKNIYDLTLLNALLKKRGEQPVSAAGLGKE